MARVTVYVAHPDDEVLGVGGTIRRHLIVGDIVHVHIECRYVRDWERRIDAARDIAAVLGYTVSFGCSPEHATQVRLADSSADIIYTHHTGDLNSDHRLVAEAALVAGRFARTVRTFETVSSTEWGLTPFLPDYYVGIDIDAKIGVLARYATEMRQAPHPRSESVIRALAVYRGAAAVLGAAEAFHTVRDSWR